MLDVLLELLQCLMINVGSGTKNCILAVGVRLQLIDISICDGRRLFKIREEYESKSRSQQFRFK